MAMRDEIKRRMVARRREAAKSPLDAILSPEPEPTVTNKELDAMGANAPMMGIKVCCRCGGKGFLGGVAPGQHGWIGAPPCPDCAAPLKPQGNTVLKPDPIAAGDVHFAEPAPRKRPPNSPKARDARMKGRLPKGSWFATGEYGDKWQVALWVPYDGPGNTWFEEKTWKLFRAENDGIHAALESLWGQYLAWKAEQTAVAKEAS